MTAYLLLVLLGRLALVLHLEQDLLQLLVLLLQGLGDRLFVSVHTEEEDGFLCGRYVNPTGLWPTLGTFPEPLAWAHPQNPPKSRPGLGPKRQ